MNAQDVGIEPQVFDGDKYTPISGTTIWILVVCNNLIITDEIKNGVETCQGQVKYSAFQILPLRRYQVSVTGCMYEAWNLLWIDAIKRYKTAVSWFPQLSVIRQSCPPLSYPISWHKSCTSKYVLNIAVAGLSPGGLCWVKEWYDVSTGKWDCATQDRDDPKLPAWMHADTRCI